MSSYGHSTAQAEVILSLEGVGASLLVDGCVRLAEAQFVFENDDLLIVQDRQDTVRIVDYTRALPRPLLLDKTGFSLTGQMVESMAETVPSSRFFQGMRPFQPLASVLKEERQQQASQPSEELEDRIVRLLCGEHAVLTTCHFGAPDLPKDEPLMLIRQGNHGFLTADDLVLRAGDQFIWGDVEEGRVIYYHDESNSKNDTLEFRPTVQEETLAVSIAIQ
jgi:hypothetical protein